MKDLLKGIPEDVVSSLENEFKIVVDFFSQEKCWNSAAYSIPSEVSAVREKTRQYWNIIHHNIAEDRKKKGLPV